MMERIHKALKRSSSASYEPLTSDLEDDHPKPSSNQPFSWLEYSIFLFLGISMLWAWYESSHFPSG